ncbi:MAG: hypothetical protein ACI91Q_002048, partial [Gammaproteobacteria bacterium]
MVLVSLEALSIMLPFHHAPFPSCSGERGTGSEKQKNPGQCCQTEVGALSGARQLDRSTTGRSTGVN